MFEGIRRKLKGVIPYSRLSDEARTIFFSLANDPDMQDYSCWRVVSDDPTKWFPNWFDYFDVSLKEIAGAKDRLSQALAIRKATVEHANASIQALKCFSEDISEEDRETLAHLISPRKDKQQFLEDQYQGYMVSDISTAVLRYLSKTFFNDAKQNDWYDLYSDAYNQLILHTYSAMIADAKGVIYPMSPLIKVLKQTTEELNERICNGENWDYDKSQIEAERADEKTDDALVPFDSELDQDLIKKYPHLAGKLEGNWLKVFASNAAQGTPLLKVAFLLYFQESTKIDFSEGSFKWDNLWDLTEELLEHLEKYHEGSVLEHEIAVATYWQMAAEAVSELVNDNAEIEGSKLETEPYTDITKIAALFPSKADHPSTEISFHDDKGVFPRESNGSAYIKEKLEALGL